MSENRRVCVHPVVLFTIIDSFERRKEDAKRVVGTLLGTVDANAVTVTNAFCVPHTESDDEVAFDMEYAKNMYDLHRKVNTNEVIVGWYATGHDITEHSVLIHEYYTKESKNKMPVHLTVDTTLTNGELGFKAYISSPIGVPGKTQGMMFTPVDVKLLQYDAERVGVDRIQTGCTKKAGVVTVPSEFQHVTEAIENLTSMLDVCLNYVKSVQDGTTPPDSNTGRFLLDLIYSVPHLSEKEFDTMLNNNINDLLMVRYLTNVLQAQLTLNEKLVNTSLIQQT
ncbi:eukaryotic translation initiation factor 3 subunit F-like [Styela clava]|uniref:eukaryotic translation initiation factor 3 subunit F-like n=1 Tax=Styela clava TaxID=7725 RepID=UPI0019392B7C|nr:eukaryotic translation initiation factor 3 subunit F-like [Styela clava]XP_039249339.1 eukaryotic translation initiation factor 3 subunit F-like [Styela clava]